MDSSAQRIQCVVRGYLARVCFSKARSHFEHAAALIEEAMRKEGGCEGYSWRPGRIDEVGGKAVFASERKRQQDAESREKRSLENREREREIQVSAATAQAILDEQHRALLLLQQEQELYEQKQKQAEQQQQQQQHLEPLEEWEIKVNIAELGLVRDDDDKAAMIEFEDAEEDENLEKLEAEAAWLEQTLTQRIAYIRKGARAS